MKSKSKFLPILFTFILLLSVNQTKAQKEKKVFKAYLIVNNTSEKLKNDSRFDTNLRLKIKNVLKRKNYVLVNNSEMEEAGKSYLYIYVNIADSLKISARISSGEERVMVMPYHEKTYYYENKTDLIRYVLRYIKKNL